MAGNASGGFDAKYAFSLHLFGGLNPFPNSGCRYASDGSQLCLRSGAFSRLDQSFIRGGMFGHDAKMTTYVVVFNNNICILTTKMNVPARQLRL